jgi:SAM-dependent methyltransferase
VSIIFERAFGCPRGFLGKLGGHIMARTNRNCAVWVIELLAVQPHDKVLEVGFGPGVGIAFLTRSALAGYVAGVDASKEMVAQAKGRNKQAVESGGVDLRHGSVASLPFADDTFDSAWRLTPCKSGPTPWRDYGKCFGLSSLAAK